MLFTKVAQSMMMMLLKVDQMGTDFAKATGTGREYVGMLEDVVRTGNAAGVSFEDAGKAMKGLFEEMIGFTQMSSEAQKGIAVQVAGFETLGIAATDVADMMNTFGKTMGTTAQGSIDLTRQLALMGGVVGISSQKMIKNFQEANKTLAVYGKGSLKVFTNLAAAAKAAGVEMSTLLGIAGKFDTFESAADSVGKLNAILGSQMSSTKMLMMTEDERIETLIMQINASGQSFAQMDRFKQKAIANAAGITDMAEANRIFGMSMGQYREHTKQMKEAETSQRKMEEAMKATVPIQEMFQRMMIEFAPKVTPLLETVRVALGHILDFLSFMNDKFGSYFPLMIAGAGALAVVLKVMSGPMKLVGALSKASGLSGMIMAKSNKAVAKTSKKAAKGYKQLGKGLGQMGKKGSAAIPVLMAMGASVMMMGVGVAIAAVGVAQLVMAFAGLSGAQVLGAIGVIALLTVVFVAFFAVMGAALYTGVLPATAGAMMAMGFAALMLGAGIAIAAFGMTMLVKSIGELAMKGPAVALSFMMISGGIFAIAAGAAVLLIPMYLMMKVLAGAAATSMLAGAGFGMLAIGIGLTVLAAVLLGGAFMVIAEGLAGIMANAGDAAMAFMGMGLGLAGMALGVAAMFAFISNPLGWLVIGGAMAVMAAAIAVFVEGIKSIPEESLVAISKLADSMTALNAMQAEATVIAKVTTDLKQFKDTMDSTLQAQIASLSTFNDVNAMNQTRAETQIQQQIQLPPVNVNLKTEQTTNIGDKKFAEHVHEATKQINWRGSDGAKKIYLNGYEEAVG